MCMHMWLLVILTSSQRNVICQFRRPSSTVCDFKCQILYLRRWKVGSLRGTDLVVEPAVLLWRNLISSPQLAVASHDSLDVAWYHSCTPARPSRAALSLMNEVWTIYSYGNSELTLAAPKGSLFALLQACCSSPPDSPQQAKPVSCCLSLHLSEDFSQEIDVID